MRLINYILVICTFILSSSLFPLYASCPTSEQIFQTSEPQHLKTLLNKAKPKKCQKEFNQIWEKINAKCPSESEIRKRDSITALNELQVRAKTKTCAHSRSLIGQRMFSLMQKKQNCLSEKEIQKETDPVKLAGLLHYSNDCDQNIKYIIAQRMKTLLQKTGAECPTDLPKINKTSDLSKLSEPLLLSSQCKGLNKEIQTVLLKFEYQTHCLQLVREPGDDHIKLLIKYDKAVKGQCKEQKEAILIDLKAIYRINAKKIRSKKRKGTDTTSDIKANTAILDQVIEMDFVQYQNPPHFRDYHKPNIFKFTLGAESTSLTALNNKVTPRYGVLFYRLNKDLDSNFYGSILQTSSGELSDVATTVKSEEQAPEDSTTDPATKTEESESTTATEKIQPTLDLETGVFIPWDESLFDHLRWGAFAYTAASKIQGTPLATTRTYYGARFAYGPEQYFDLLIGDTKYMVSKRMEIRFQYPYFVQESMQRINFGLIYNWGFHRSKRDIINTHTGKVDPDVLQIYLSWDGDFLFSNPED